MEGGAPGRMPENVVEAACLYDTIQIRKDAKEVEGYISYQALSGRENIPFFTVRNRSEVGLAYTNKDSKESMPWPFTAYSIGVRFYAPRSIGPMPQVPPTGAAGAIEEAAHLFQVYLPLHTGFVLKVRDDEKLAHTCEAAPPGMGPMGVALPLNPLATNIVAQGWPDFRNRFQFPNPISIPRNCIVEVQLKFSDHAKKILTGMQGPPIWELWTGGPDPEPTKISVPACGLIRVSLEGARQVQQRGELHY